MEQREGQSLEEADVAYNREPQIAEPLRIRQSVVQAIRPLAEQKIYHSSSDNNYSYNKVSNR